MTRSNVLDQHHVFLLDTDGVLVRGGEPMPGVVEAFR